MQLIKPILRWLIYFIPAILIELMCFILAPIVALLITHKAHTGAIKRLNNRNVALMREYLIKPLYWFQTHDNPVDEWWWGRYNESHYFQFAKNWRQYDYNTKSWVRYYCRLMWLWRNPAYGFHYNLFALPVENNPKVYLKGNEYKGYWHRVRVFKSSFQIQLRLPITAKKYIDINIGWKSHPPLPKLLYANRIFSLKTFRG